MERKKRVEIRLSAEEHQKMIELKTKRRLAQWIRETCLDDGVDRYNSIDQDTLWFTNFTE